MKKYLLLILTSVILLGSCQKDDLSWMQEIESIKAELANQKKLIEALQANANITGIETNGDSYTIKFSNGQSITLTNGKTPLVTIGDNGNWNINGEDTGCPSRGSDGEDGKNGSDGITPTIEIVDGHWWINGKDTGIKAEGKDGSSAPYITSILSTGKEMYFYFSDNSCITTTIYNNLIHIKYRNSKNFDVTIPGKYGNDELQHVFTRQYNNDNIKIGDNTIQMTTADIWYESEIYDDGNNIVQGNLNFIYMLESSVPGFEKEKSHIGAGHGCEVSVFQKFYADGVEFNPRDPFDDLYCEDLTIICKSNTYAVDVDMPGFSSSHALPKVDQDGNMMLNAVHTYTAKYSVGNVVDIDNSLIIKRDNLIFNQCHGAMLQGNYPHFNQIIIQDENFTNVKYAFNGESFDLYSVDNSKNIKTNPFSKANSLVMIGDKHIVTQTIESNTDANYTFAVFYNAPPRLKIYQMPVRTSTQFGVNSADIFNKGDIINVKVHREIK